MTPSKIFRGEGASALRQSIKQLAQSGEWPLLEPLPVTRFLGQSFGISNVHAHRVLRSLLAEGVLWRAPNGRFYLARAARLIEKPHPIACLFRRFEHWTAVSRELMEGIDTACGDLDRAMLLIHDRALFVQETPVAPTMVGSIEKQITALKDFAALHGESTAGVVLDELWSDEALRAVRGKLHNAVVVYRRCRVQGVGNVFADVDAAARRIIRQARETHCQNLGILTPFPYAPSDELAEAVRRAANKEHFPEPSVWDLSHSQTLPRLAAELRRNKNRTLLIGTEDNTLVPAIHTLEAEGIAIPDRVGVISGMGSLRAREAGVTSVGFDFRLMGHEAAKAAAAEKPAAIPISPTFFPGRTL